jgi:hypothetical protein
MTALVTQGWFRAGPSHVAEVAVQQRQMQAYGNGVANRLINGFVAASGVEPATAR